MKILNRLPILDRQYESEIRGEALKTRPFQVIVQVSLSDTPVWDPRIPVIPALLDTGHNHNFSIRERHLIRWAGLHLQTLPLLGTMRESDRVASLRFANLWIHRNQPGSRNLKGSAPYLLALKEGIAVYPDNGSNYPRLPLLGLRAIVKNNLRLLIDGKRRHASLSLPIW
jgi:hypothetical protein